MAKIIYFTAGPVPTVDELADIAALNASILPAYEVAVRNTLANNSYGAGPEAADFVAGTIPTAYSDAEDYPVINPDTVAADHVSLAEGVGYTGVTLVGTAGAGKTMTLAITAGVVTTATFT